MYKNNLSEQAIFSIVGHLIAHSALPLRPFCVVFVSSFPLSSLTLSHFSTNQRRISTAAGRCNGGKYLQSRNSTQTITFQPPTHQGPETECSYNLSFLSKLGGVVSEAHKSLVFVDTVGVHIMVNTRQFGSLNLTETALRWLSMVHYI